MAYPLHLYKKVFLATNTGAANAGYTLTDSAVLTAVPAAVNHVLGLNTASSTGPVGVIGVYNENDTLVNINVAPQKCCKIKLRNSTAYTVDKIGSHGGYQEPAQSILIDPKNILKFQRIEPCAPQNAVVSLGHTPGTNNLVPNRCCKEFLCDETYFFRVDVKGTPALSAYQHQIYRHFAVYTGCCTSTPPTPINSTDVFINLGIQISKDPQLKDFVFPIVYDEATGNPYYPDGTTVDPLTGGPVVPAQWFSAWTMGTPHTPNKCAGIRLVGAYVDTRFKTCTFYPTDGTASYIEPILIRASEVDFNNQPCGFGGTCEVVECEGRMGNGFGETILREWLDSEATRQHYAFNYDDLRLREVFHGDDLINAINRFQRYRRYLLIVENPQHVFTAAGGTTEKYAYHIIVDPAVTLTAFENYIVALENLCKDCSTFEVVDCPAPCNVPTSFTTWK